MMTGIKRRGTLKLLSRYAVVLLLSLFGGCVSDTPPAPAGNSITESAALPAGLDPEIPAAESRAVSSEHRAWAAEHRREREREIGKLQKSNRRSNYSGDAVFANFREIRGGTIPAAAVYRSCHPAAADARAPYAARLAEQARIAAVINLSDTREELEAKAAFIPWYQKFITKNSIIPLGMGLDYTDPEFKAGLRAGLQFMLNHRGPYLIHCNDGTDRTGFVAALLEALAGAGADEIAGDYMRSYVNYYHLSQEEERYRIFSTFITDVLTELNGGKPLADRSNVKEAAERYLTNEIGLTGAELDGLKQRLSGIE